MGIKYSTKDIPEVQEPELAAWLGKGNNVLDMIVYLPEELDVLLIPCNGKVLASIVGEVLLVGYMALHHLVASHLDSELDIRAV